MVLIYAFRIFLIIGILFSAGMVGHSLTKLNDIKILDESVNDCENSCMTKSIQFEENMEFFQIACMIGCYDAGTFYLKNGEK